jgi:VCBS repeat-containing protein
MDSDMKHCDNDNTVTYSNVTQASNLSPKILLNYPRKNALFTIRENATPILMALFSAGLAGCSTGPTTTTGTALKGRLENAEVFIDTNGDGSWTSGIDSDKVRTDSSGNFSIPESSDLTGDIVVTTDETTIDTSSGSMISGVTLSAPNGSSVVSVATTLTNELMDSSTATLTQTEAEAQIKTLLGIDPTIDVSSYDPFTEDNIGTAAALEFEQSAHQVMTIINTLAEAESSTNVGTEVTKSEAVDNAIKAFVDVIETEISNNTDTALDFTASSVIDSIVAEYDDTSSALKDASFSDSLTAIKTAITQVNTAIDTVTSLSTEHNPTFAIAQSNLVDMTQSVAENNNGFLATIDSTTDISTLLAVSGTFLGTSSEDSSDDSNTDGDIELSGSIAVIDPDTADAVTFSFSTTVTSSDGALGSLIITESGAWTYTLDDSVSSIQSLDAGDIYKESFAVTANASDSSSSVSKTIRISVTGTNDAPTVSAVIADQSIAEDSTLSFVVPDGSFADVDSGDSLTYTATLADGSELPTWLSFDGNTKTFSGTPTNDAVGNIEVAVTATDSASASISDTYTLTVSNTNDVPTLAGDITGSVTEDTTTTTTTGTLTGADVDTGDTLTYSIAETSGTYGSIAIDSATGEWTYTLSNTDTDTDALAASASVTETFSAVVTDAAAAQSTAQTITITITGANDAPVASDIPALSTISNLNTYTISDDDLLAVTADVDTGNTLTISDISLDTSTAGAIDGNIFTPASDYDGDAVFTFTVSDGTATDIGTATITVLDAIPLGTADEDTSSISISNSGDAIPGGATISSLSLQSSSSAAGTLTDNGDGSWGFAPTADFNGIVLFDSVLSSSLELPASLTISAVNDVPTLETALVDQSATEGTEFSYAIASSSFADVDSGDTLTYTATQTGGAALPSWLNFDGDTQTFSGTPTAEATLDITVTASDSTAMITDAFSLTVANTNDAPVFTSSASVSTTERTYLADTVTATDEEDDAISYSISGGADSGFFGIDSSSGALTFSGADNVRASSLIALPTNASQPSVLFDNFAIDGTTATVDAYLLPKAAGFDALTGFQMNMTTSSGSVSFGASASGWTIIANAGSLSGFSNNIAYADLQATKIGTFTIADYSTSATTTVSGIVFDGGVYGSTSTSSQTMANLTLTPVTAPPINGANGSANADDIYTVEVTATDANSATTAQTLNVTVTATADADHASVTSTWTGTSSADTYTIDEYSGLTITADGGDGGNDTVKLAVLDHVLWDTTSGGTTELTATLVDMEIIDIGNLVSSNDSTAVTIGDFSTNMAIDSTSAASLIDGNDSQVSIMGTANDIVTLSGTTWDKGVSSNLSSGDYASETLVAWSDGTSTLYIDQDINIVTPDIT